MKPGKLSTNGLWVELYGEKYNSSGNKRQHDMCQSDNQSSGDRRFKHVEYIRCDTQHPGAPFTNMN